MIIFQANGANEDGTTFPGLGKIDYVLTEASVYINTVLWWEDNFVFGQI